MKTICSLAVALLLVCGLAGCTGGSSSQAPTLPGTHAQVDKTFAPLPQIKEAALFSGLIQVGDHLFSLPLSHQALGAAGYSPVKQDAEIAKEVLSNRNADISYALSPKNPGVGQIKLVLNNPDFEKTGQTVPVEQAQVQIMSATGQGVFLPGGIGPGSTQAELLAALPNPTVIAEDERSIDYKYLDVPFDDQFHPGEPDEPLWVSGNGHGFLVRVDKETSLVSLISIQWMPEGTQPIPLVSQVGDENIPVTLTVPIGCQRYVSEAGGGMYQRVVEIEGARYIITYDPRLSARPLLPYEYSTEEQLLSPEFRTGRSTIVQWYPYNEPPQGVVWEIVPYDWPQEEKSKQTEGEDPPPPPYLSAIGYHVQDNICVGQVTFIFQRMQLQSRLMRLIPVEPGTTPSAAAIEAFAEQLRELARSIEIPPQYLENA